MSVPPGYPIIKSEEGLVSEGNETEMNCTAAGSKPAAVIRWMKGDKELQGWFGEERPHTHTPMDVLIKLVPLYTVDFVVFLMPDQ